MNSIDYTINKFITDINKAKRYPVLGIKTKNNAPNSAGVYIIWKKGYDKPVYVGETKDINARMKDITRTWNHTLRRKIGFFEFGKKLEGRGKYNPDIEMKIDNFMKERLEVSFFDVDFGRKELEEEVIRRFSPKYNSKIKRGERKR